MTRPPPVSGPRTSHRTRRHAARTRGTRPEMRPDTSPRLRVGRSELSPARPQSMIVFFLIVEPAALARLWQITREKLRLWPFPYSGPNLGTFLSTRVSRGWGRSANQIRRTAMRLVFSIVLTASMAMASTAHARQPCKYGQKPNVWLQILLDERAGTRRPLCPAERQLLYFRCKYLVEINRRDSFEHRGCASHVTELELETPGVREGHF